jgi:hypothetical protein
MTNSKGLNVMTKDKKFQMRCTQQFLDDLDGLGESIGLKSRSATIELTINIYPALVKMMRQHEDMLAKLKLDLQ